jgi:hypothetical protein
MSCTIACSPESFGVIVEEYLTIINNNKPVLHFAEEKLRYLLTTNLAEASHQHFQLGESLGTFHAATQFSNIDMQLSPCVNSQ